MQLVAASRQTCAVAHSGQTCSRCSCPPCRQKSSGSGRVVMAGLPLAAGLFVPRKSKLGTRRRGRRVFSGGAGLRQKLAEGNGLPELEQLYVVQDDCELAAEIFRDAGFVLIPGAVSPEHCSELLAGCRAEEAEILHRDPAGVGNRGHGRYSLGEAQSTGHLLHRAEWASLVDLEKVTPVLQRIFGKSGYVCAGAGGDFVLPNTYEYQPLHVDLDFPGCQKQSASPVVTLNVPLLPLTWENGPTRLIPGTHLPASWQPPPPALEPEAWKLFTFCPIPAGTAILRDNRAWHGGTPNLSQTSRFLPNVEFAATWWCVGSTDELWRNPWKLAPRCMPRGIYERLSPFAKHVCRLVVTDDPSLKYGVREGKPIIDQPKEPEMPTPNRSLWKNCEATFWIPISGSNKASMWIVCTSQSAGALPWGRSVDSAAFCAEDGSLYVADFTSFCVFRFAADDSRGRVVAGEDGKQLMDVDYLKDIDRPLASPEGEGFLLKNPIDVVSSPDGLLVLDCAAARVQSFQPGEGQSAAGRVRVPPSTAPPAKSVAAPEALKHPRAIFLEDDGIVVCDTWSHRVLRYRTSASPPEVLAGTPNSCGSEPGKLNFPSCVAFCANGSLLVSDTNNHRVQRFRPGECQGETVAGSAEGKSGSSLTELNMPTGLVVEADGSFLVADRANARVLRFREGGGAGEVVAGPDLLERPWGLALGPDGSVYVSDERRAVVLKLAGTKPKQPKTEAAPLPSGYPPQMPAEEPSGGYPGPGKQPAAAPATPDLGMGLD
ncbi:Trim71 [Symbiodinium sp. CCMP2592]|nr:Trim71 [Symbiodinium sp. CCMP2592]